jgi:hypothetical protein
MQPKRGRGRPRLPPEEVRMFAVHVTVTRDERRRIQLAARAEDVSVSAWLRRWIIEGLKRQAR